MGPEDLTKRGRKLAEAGIFLREGPAFSFSEMKKTQNRENSVFACPLLRLCRSLCYDAGCCRQLYAVRQDEMPEKRSGCLVQAG